MGGVTAVAAREHRTTLCCLCCHCHCRSVAAGLNEQRHALDVALAIAVLMRVSPRLQLMVVRVPTGLEALSTHLREALTAAGFDLLGVFGAPAVAASMS